MTLEKLNTDYVVYTDGLTFDILHAETGEVIVSIKPAVNGVTVKYIADTAKISLSLFKGIDIFDELGNHIATVIA